MTARKITKRGSAPQAAAAAPARAKADAEHDVHMARHFPAVASAQGVAPQRFDLTRRDGSLVPGVTEA